jgi:hypothetical protein
VAEARLTAQRLNQLLQQAGDMPVEKAAKVGLSIEKARSAVGADEVEDLARVAEVQAPQQSGSQAETLEEDDDSLEEIAFDDERLSIEPESDPFAGLTTEEDDEAEPDEATDDEEFEDLDHAEPRSKKLMKVERMAL